MNPPILLVQKAWTISKAPAKMDTQPMNMVLITVTSMTSPSTKKSRQDHDEPKQDADPERRCRQIADTHA